MNVFITISLIQWCLAFGFATISHSISKVYYCALLHTNIHSSYTSFGKMEHFCFIAVLCRYICWIYGCIRAAIGRWTALYSNLKWSVFGFISKHSPFTTIHYHSIHSAVTHALILCFINSTWALKDILSFWIWLYRFVRLVWAFNSNFRFKFFER